MRVVLIATYELGRQPFGLASPAAWLREAGHHVTMCDASRGPIDRDAVAAADLIGVHLPMHTATRLALPILAAARAQAPAARLCAFGLYAPPNADHLQACGVDVVPDPSSRPTSPPWPMRWAPVAAGHRRRAARAAAAGVPRARPQPAAAPRYAHLARYRWGTRIVGATEASRGCKHLCRHCPIVPVYRGHFRVVPVEVVLADIDQLVAAGATHITFGDPDFFNGVTHAIRIVESLAVRYPGLTYDVTIKVEHLRRHRSMLQTLVSTGCAFVTSAFESFDDDVLGMLAKGHTCADAEQVVAHARSIGLAIAPTFVAFGPWTTLERYARFLDTIAERDLVDAVAPAQLGLRLLLPAGSPLVEVPAVAARIQGFDAGQLAHRWAHDDPRIDTLQRDVMATVGAQARRSRREAYDAVVACAAARGTGLAASRDAGRTRATAIATIDEPWYC
jgi:hypothetical protein